MRRAIMLLGVAGWMCLAGCKTTQPMAVMPPATTSASATTQAAALPPGLVQAFIVKGDVQLMREDGLKRPLVKGNVFTEHNAVITGTDGAALLVFSNGATVRVPPGTQMEISHFRQAPFDEKVAGGTFLRLTRDPSRSDIRIYLSAGSIQGQVKGLNTAAGSTFVINIPGGTHNVESASFNVSADEFTPSPQRG